MTRKVEEYIQELKTHGLDPGREALMRRELASGGEHLVPEESVLPEDLLYSISLYAYHDLPFIQNMTPAHRDYHSSIRSLDELLERDKQREEDGFPRKIRMGRLIKPGKGGKDKIIVVPTTVEEKLIHDQIRLDEDEAGGSGGGGAESLRTWTPTM